MARRRMSIALLAALWLVAPGLRAFQLHPDFHYSTSETAINAYDDAGVLVASLPWGSNHDVRGLAIGPDGLLYVVRAGTQGPLLTTVEVLGPDGQLMARFGNGAWSAGNLSLGKIAFAPDRHVFYVGTSGGIYEFNQTTRSGRRLVADPAYGLDVLPNGELLVGADSTLYRRTPGGAFIHAFTNIDDPDGLTGVVNPRMVGIRDVAYSAATDRTYVTMGGYSGFFFRLLAFQGTSNRLVAQTYFWYGDDIHVDDAGNLLVGSRTQAPAWFTPELELIGQLDGPAARFVTGFRALYYESARPTRQDRQAVE
ncbi:MAG: hypothetical protein KF823_06345 [Xanthomonadales bacterium]|nr:hypothetical protein [Xanthomonadales bacterium]